jgi:Na+/H+-dicarboxylate symporter
VKRLSLTGWIFVSMATGIVLGLAAPDSSSHLAPISNIFLRLIRSIGRFSGDGSGSRHASGGNTNRVILAGALAQFGLPLEGVAVLLGVDALLDMARTSVNVAGNCLASAVVARWEGVKLSA